MSILDEIIKDVNLYDSKCIKNVYYEPLFNLIHTINKSTDYGLSADSHIELDIKDRSDIYVNDIFIGRIEDLRDFKNNGLELIFNDYIIEIQILILMNNTPIQDNYLGVIKKKNLDNSNEKILFEIDTLNL